MSTESVGPTARGTAFSLHSAHTVSASTIEWISCLCRDSYRSLATFGSISHQISITSGLPDWATPLVTYARSRGRYHHDSTMAVPGIAAASCHMVSEAISPRRPRPIIPGAISASASFRWSLEMTGRDRALPSSRLSVVFPEPGRPLIKIKDLAMVHCRFECEVPAAAGPVSRLPVQPPGNESSARFPEPGYSQYQ